jgi:hypothetical protein
MAKALAQGTAVQLPVGLEGGEIVLLKPTAHPSFPTTPLLLIGLLGGPKVTDVRLYAEGLGVAKSGNFGAGTRFQVEPS